MFETLFVITFTKTGVGSLGRACSLGRSSRGSHTSCPAAAAAAARRTSASARTTTAAGVAMVPATIGLFEDRPPSAPTVDEWSRTDPRKGIGTLENFIAFPVLVSSLPALRTANDREKKK